VQEKVATMAKTAAAPLLYDFPLPPHLNTWTTTTTTAIIMIIHPLSSIALLPQLSLLSPSSPWDGVL
jgi:hypothetical protein